MAGASGAYASCHGIVYGAEIAATTPAICLHEKYGLAARTTIEAEEQGLLRGPLHPAQKAEFTTAKPELISFRRGHNPSGGQENKQRSP
jgi:hypothetical protein